MEITDLEEHKEHYRIFNRRLLIALLFILAVVAGIITRLWYLQIDQHRFYSTLSQKNVLAILPIEPSRGLIYDRNGVLLAYNTPVLSLMITPARVADFPTTIRNLRQLINITNNDLQEFEKRRWQYRPYEPNQLKAELTEVEADNFYVNQYRFPGVSIQANMMRNYPYKELLSHLVGYVGRINQQELTTIDPANYSPSDYIGKAGIEKQYETALHGQVGSQEVETDANSKIVRTLKSTPPVPGQDLYLTIDIRLQQAARDALGNETGAVIAMNPQNGEILAMVTKPGFDPNPFVTGISRADFQKLLNDPERPLYNRDIRGLYAPGSTMKPFYALKGLDSGTITTDTRIHDPGWFRIPHVEHQYRDWQRHGHGVVDVVKAITVSCDTFFYTLAYNIGIHSMDNTLHAFGFGKKTGIDLPGELPGLVPSPEWKKRVKGQPWYLGDTIVCGIGQGYLLVTPLQLLQAVAIMANHGMWVEPHVLLFSEAANDAITTLRVPAKQVIKLSNPAFWDVVIGGMVGVIKNPNGTAYHFGRDAPYTAAGKTGTSQVFGLHGGEGDKDQSKIPRLLRDNKFFIVFAPVENPKIAVAVLIEHNIGSDGVARKVIDYYLHDLNAGKLMPPLLPLTTPGPMPTPIIPFLSPYKPQTKGTSPTPFLTAGTPSSTAVTTTPATAATDKTVKPVHRHKKSTVTPSLPQPAALSH